MDSQPTTPLAPVDEATRALRLQLPARRESSIEEPALASAPYRIVADCSGSVDALPEDDFSHLYG